MLWDLEMPRPEFDVLCGWRVDARFYGGSMIGASLLVGRVSSPLSSSSLQLFSESQSPTKLSMQREQALAAWAS